MIKKCLICNKEFFTIPSIIKKGFGKYCSMECRNTTYGQPRKIPIIKNCKICNKVFKPRSDHLKIGMGKFCSRKCAYKSFIGRKPSKKWKLKMSIGMKKAWKKPNNKFLKIKRSGINSPTWKGGRTVGNNGIGYVFIKNLKHPFANPNGYVREHRLVMEKHLGRYLKPEEVIHHLNGIKTDNRLKNLKLFSNSSEHKRFHRLKIIKIKK